MKISVKEAEDIVEQDKWQCKTCSFPSQEDSEYCLSCEIYWKDVEEGLFDDTRRDFAELDRGIPMKSDDEMNGLAHGIYMHVVKETESPVEGVGIIGIVLLRMFDDHNKTMTIEEFAEEFKQSMIELWKAAHNQSGGSMYADNNPSGSKAN